MERQIILDFVFPKCEFAVLHPRVEKLGLELDNRGQTTKNDHRRICSL